MFEETANLSFKDSKPRCRILASSRSKIHQLRYFPILKTESDTSDVLALSTEDGRVLFYATHSTETSGDKQPESEQTIPCCPALGQLGGPATGMKGRIKDFEILILSSLKGRAESFLIVTGGSDGALRVWTLGSEELSSERLDTNGESDMANENAASRNNTRTNGSNTGASAHQVGHLIGSYETGNRITCLKAFVMSRPSAVDGLGHIDGDTVDTGRTGDNGHKGTDS